MTTTAQEEPLRTALPTPSVQVKVFRRVSMVDGEEKFEEIYPRAGERRVDFVWGKGVDGFIPPVELEAEPGRRKSRRKLSKESSGGHSTGSDSA